MSVHVLLSLHTSVRLLTNILSQPTNSSILDPFTASVKGQGEVYKTVIRPAMMYGVDTWAVKKPLEKKLDVAEMRMLR